MPEAYQTVIQTYRHTDGRILTEVGNRNQSHSRPATEDEAAAFMAAEAARTAQEPDSGTQGDDPIGEPESAPESPPTQPKRGPGRPRNAKD